MAAWSLLLLFDCYKPSANKKSCIIENYQLSTSTEKKKMSGAAKQNTAILRLQNKAKQYFVQFKYTFLCITKFN